ncbi:MAG: O-antigen ligase family protein [Hyphomicrobiaceae bacterium]
MAELKFNKASLQQYYWDYTFPSFFFLLPLVSVISSNTLAFLPVLITLLMLPCLSFAEISNFVKSSKQLKIFAVFILYGLFLIGWTENHLAALRTVASTLAVGLFGIVNWQIVAAAPTSSRIRAQISFVCGFAITALCMLLALQGFLTLPDIHAISSGLPVVYNRSAVLIALLLPAMLAIACDERNSKIGLPLTIQFAVIGLGFLSIWVSTSETAKLISIFVPLTFLIVRQFKIPALRLISVALVAMYLLWIPTWTFVGNLMERGTISISDSSYGSAGTRIKYWVFAGKKWREAPFFGGGIETLTEQRIDFLGRPLAVNATSHPHSAVSQTWLDLGGCGVFLTLSLIVGGLHKLESQASPFREGTSATIVAALLGFSVSHGMWQSWYHGMMGFALAAVCLTWRPREPSDVAM